MTGNGSLRRRDKYPQEATSTSPEPESPVQLRRHMYASGHCPRYFPLCRDVECNQTGCGTACVLATLAAVALATTKAPFVDEQKAPAVQVNGAVLTADPHSIGPTVGSLAANSIMIQC
jgi:hypothetical protein